MYPKKSRKKERYSRTEVQPSVWLPETSRFGGLLQANGIRYAIFGAEALATNDIMVRPTVDIDFVVEDYPKAVALLNVQTYYGPVLSGSYKLVSRLCGKLRRMGNTEVLNKCYGGIPEHIKAQMAKSVHVKFDTLNLSMLPSMQLPRFY